MNKDCETKWTASLVYRNKNITTLFRKFNLYDSGTFVTFFFSETEKLWLISVRIGFVEVNGVEIRGRKILTNESMIRLGGIDFKFKNMRSGAGLSQRMIEKIVGSSNERISMENVVELSGKDVRFLSEYLERNGLFERVVDDWRLDYRRYIELLEKKSEPLVECILYEMGEECFSKSFNVNGLWENRLFIGDLITKENNNEVGVEKGQLISWPYNRMCGDCMKCRDCAGNDHRSSVSNEYKCNNKLKERNSDYKIINKSEKINDLDEKKTDYKKSTDIEERNRLNENNNFKKITNLEEVNSSFKEINNLKYRNKLENISYNNLNHNMGFYLNNDKADCINEKNDYKLFNSNKEKDCRLSDKDEVKCKLFNSNKEKDCRLSDNSSSFCLKGSLYKSSGSDDKDHGLKGSFGFKGSLYKSSGSDDKDHTFGLKGNFGFKGSLYKSSGSDDKDHGLKGNFGFKDSLYKSGSDDKDHGLKGSLYKSSGSDDKDHGLKGSLYKSSGSDDKDHGLKGNFDDKEIKYFYSYNSDESSLGRCNMQLCEEDKRIDISLFMKECREFIERFRRQYGKRFDLESNEICIGKETVNPCSGNKMNEVSPVLQKSFLTKNQEAWIRSYNDAKKVFFMEKRLRSKGRSFGNIFEYVRGPKTQYLFSPNDYSSLRKSLRLVFEKKTALEDTSIVKDWFYKDADDCCIKRHQSLHNVETGIEDVWKLDSNYNCSTKIDGNGSGNLEICKYNCNSDGTNITNMYKTYNSIENTKINDKSDIITKKNTCAIFPGNKDSIFTDKEKPKRKAEYKPSKRKAFSGSGKKYKISYTFSRSPIVHPRPTYSIENNLYVKEYLALDLFKENYIEAMRNRGALPISNYRIFNQRAESKYRKNKKRKEILFGFFEI